MITRSTVFDVIIIGAGHNGLIAATILARSGLKVLALEEGSVVGGAARTELPFRKARGVGSSTAAYLLGVMPPEILKLTGAKIETLRRDPHYFLPTLDRRYLLFGSDRAENRAQFTRFFSDADWRANELLQSEIACLRNDLAPAWLAEPLSVEETAARYIRPALQQTFLDLVRDPVENYLRRFGFRSDLLIAMYAVTDGFSGLSASFGTPGTGHNFLVHSMCRLPHSDGTWMVVKGGMGCVSRELARCAHAAGAEIVLNSQVERVLLNNGNAAGVLLTNGDEIRSDVILSNADPFRTREMVRREELPQSFNAKLDAAKRTGTTMKVNMALEKLPVFKCLSADRGQHRGTMHLLPQGDDVVNQIRLGFDAVKRGELSDRPTIEWYIHTAVDPSLMDDQGRHNAAFFVQWVPYEIRGSTWEREQERYVERLFSIAEEFAPGFRSTVVDTDVLTPKTIESRFGIRYGHIHHIDNTFAFDARMPYAWPIGGLYSCSAGTHPGGSMIGAAGHNAAMRVLTDMGRAPSE